MPSVKLSAWITELVLHLPDCSLEWNKSLMISTLLAATVDKDLPKIRKEMQRIIKRDLPFVREEVCSPQRQGAAMCCEQERRGCAPALLMPVPISAQSAAAC